MTNASFWRSYNEVDRLLKKAFIQMPGGQDPAAAGMSPGGDPAAAGMPMDPSMMGGAPMDPSMMGGAPMDPAAAGMPMDPAMMGGAPMDPSMMGGAPGAAPETAPGSPMITISLDQLFEIIQKVLGLAKKVGANGSGIQQPTPAPAAPTADTTGLTQDQLKATIYEALGSMAG